MKMILIIGILFTSLELFGQQSAGQHVELFNPFLSTMVFENNKMYLYVFNQDGVTVERKIRIDRGDTWGDAQTVGQLNNIISDAKIHHKMIFYDVNKGGPFNVGEAGETVTKGALCQPTVKNNSNPIPSSGSAR